MSRSADSCQQICRQLSADLPTIVSNHQYSVFNLPILHHELSVPSYPICPYSKWILSLLDLQLSKVSAAAHRRQFFPISENNLWRDEGSREFFIHLHHQSIYQRMRKSFMILFALAFTSAAQAGTSLVEQYGRMLTTPCTYVCPKAQLPLRIDGILTRPNGSGLPTQPTLPISAAPASPRRNTARGLACSGMTTISTWAPNWKNPT